MGLQVSGAFGPTIMARRKALGFRRSEITEMVPISRTLLGKWERSEGPPGAGMRLAVLQLLLVLGFTQDEIGELVPVLRRTTPVPPDLNP
jgi:transcriptional regulator with XRE-family HTH domain